MRKEWEDVYEMKKKIGKEIEIESVNYEDQGDYGKEDKEVACARIQIVTELKGKVFERLCDVRETAGR